MKISSANKKSIRRIYHKLYRFYGPQKWWPAKGDFEVMVGAVLTQNTSWKNVEKAILNLKKYDLLAGPTKIDRCNIKRLAALVKPVGYYNLKARRLKNMARFIVSRYGTLKNAARKNTAELRKDLLGVNGIGPETCDSILLYAFNRPVFVVDAYTRRLLSRHGIAKEDASYDDIQSIFTNNFVRNSRLYNEYHALIVRLGKDFCRKRAICSGCPLNRGKLACK